MRQRRRDHPRVTGHVPVCHPLREDAWFAGFVDGEGHFALAPVGTGFQPRLEISLRDDDRPILEEVQAAFGGGIRVKPGRRPGQHDQVKYAAGSRESLWTLVAYFDRFPLRAKKAKDYEVWREAVLHYHESGWRAPELAKLCGVLAEVRRYA